MCLHREDESLAKCMFASITLLAEGRASGDDLCSKFLDQCLPEVGCYCRLYICIHIFLGLY